MSKSRCDKCSEVVDDLDAGFSPGLHEMGHDCGGTWRVVADAEAVLERLREAASNTVPITWAGPEREIACLRSLLETEEDPAVRARLRARLADVEGLGEDADPTKD